MYRGTDLYMEKARLFFDEHNLFNNILSPRIQSVKLSNQFLQWTRKFLAGYGMKQNLFTEVYQ